MKFLFISTIIDTIDGFLTPHIKMLVKNGYNVDVAGNFTTQISKELKGVTQNLYNLPLQRTPFSIKNLLALKSLIKIIKENKYDVVHCHTPVASVIGRIACWLTKTKCFYTAHGFHFYKGAPLLNWLVYFPVEWLLSFVTDTLITINKEDYEFAKKHLHAKRTEYVPGVGIDVEKFSNVKIDRNAKRRELGVPENCKLLLSVGELNKNKNHQLVLKALAQIDDKNIHYAICGKGELHDYLLSLAKELKVSDRFHLLGRRDDIPEILKCSDIFVHPSLREGLPVSLMEAMASGLPCIASDIRGCRDLLENDVNGYLCPINDIKSFVKAVNELAENQIKQINQFNEALIKKYDISAIVESTNKIYFDNKKIRVLHVLNSSSFSGAENVACQIINMFKYDNRFEMAYCSLDGNIKSALEERKIKYLPVKSLNILELRKVINKFKPDIIHAHDYTASLISSLASISIPIINHLHNNNPWIKSVNKKSISYLYAGMRAKKILTVSDAIMKEFIFGKFLTGKTKTVGNPVDINYIIKKANEAEINDTSDVIFLGRLSTEKNPFLFLDIVKEVTKSFQNLKVAIVGNGKLENELKEKCKQLKLEKNINFYGFQKNPYGLLKASKVLCMPSLWEGFGLAAVESLALGKPVVASPVGGLKEIVDSDCGCLCVEKNDYANKIIELLSNEKEYKQLCNGALSKSRLFCSEKYYEAICETYKEMQRM